MSTVAGSGVRSEWTPFTYIHTYIHAYMHNTHYDFILEGLFY